MDSSAAAYDARPIQWPDQPYKGLNFFRESDAPLFTERDFDVRDCGMLLGQFSTRVLLLHGNSGAGKSSFLRAGLVPWLKQQHGAFYFLTDEASELIFVRSTDDPVYQVHEVLRAAFQSDPQLSKLATPDIAAAKQRLSQPAEKDRELLAAKVVEALSAIAMALTPHLVLMIDQSEEVFSAGTPTDEDNRRLAFFNMLEEICFQNLPLKVIVVMRTEFYGRFSNALGILPRTNVENADIGFRQYLLRDLHTRESLVAVIRRPTLDGTEVEPNPPRSVYGFTFEQGVPELLADDLLSQFGESGPLPVLQIVCETLYRNVVTGAKRAVITAADYTSVGNAQGFMEKYIDSAIAEALPGDDPNPAREHIVRWRHVLASLAGRQGSGSVTTLIARESSMVQTAEAQGVTEDIEATLARMTERRLLRKVASLSRVDEAEPKYSLGHDALAASLCIWSEAWNTYEGQLTAAERENERWRKRMKARATTFAGIFTCIALTAGGLIFYDHFNTQNTILKRVTTLVEESREPTFSDKLLGLMSTLDLTKSFMPLPERHAAELVLRKVLWRAPRYGGTADAAGFDLASRRIAYLSADGTVVVQAFAGSNERRNLGKITDQKALTPFPSATVGFVKGLDNPVVYKNGFLHAYNGTQWVAPFDITTLLPPEFLTGTPPFVDIAGGSLRVVVSNLKQGTFNLLLVKGEQHGQEITFRAAGNITVSRGESRYFPTISDSSGFVARLAPDQANETEALLVADMSEPVPVWGAVARMPPLNQQTGLNFARSISFSPDGAFLAMRQEQDWVKLFAIRSAPMRPTPTIRLENWPNSVPTSWPNLRPLMAAVERPSGDWRVAWPTTAGIVVGEGKFGGKLQPLLGKTTDGLYSDANDAMRLKFSDDGSLLVAESKGFRGRQSRVLVWDLSPDRQKALDALPLGSLRDEACRVAAISGSAELKQDDMNALFGQRVNQPCPLY
ncbi:nSTAND1 domain-containing NTPase [Rhizobium sp. RAF56]|uniref:nSTAND1 domain-containing NTPase n=1 Tax=Rhizobium sp. RAF56 TaxID=3233062 RepID=UPI003F9D73FC